MAKGNIFFNLATNATHVPTAVTLHVCGDTITSYMPGRVLDEDITLGRAAALYGTLTAFGRNA